ncbi:MAG: crotonase/enoyl-CoA hydratase family protein [Pseudomonadales bacterium]|nr:crotonase/enoyl-CoA hydratase family protein [Pseudomonadales bacterium]
MSNPVSYELKDQYCVISLDDGKANAVSPALVEGMHAALDQAEKDQKTVLVVGREGKFSAGFDLSIMGQGGQAMADLVVAGAKLSQRMLTHPYPIVVVCTGHALAMGALLLLSADYRIGIEGNFKIGLNEVAIGLTMPYFGVELGRHRLNGAFVNRAVTNAELFSPQGALHAGFIDQLVSPENAMASAEQIIQNLNAINMDAHKGTKVRVREPLLAGIKAGVEKDFGVTI